MASEHEARMYTVPPEAAALRGELTLRGGARVWIRPIMADDTARLRDFHRRLSPEAVVFRFFRLLLDLPESEAEHFTHVDYRDRMALVATLGPANDAPILAVVRYERIGSDVAEVAFVVEDAWQGHGIGTALLHRLAAYARQRGIHRFVAITLGYNVRMLDLLHMCGFPASSVVREDEVEVTLDISRPPQWHDAEC